MLNKNNISFLEVVRNFEKEIIGKGEFDFEIANACDFIVFEKDETYVYGLQYDLSEKTFSIVAELFEPNGGDWITTEYIESFPLHLYNREFLISRISYHISEAIKEYEREKRKSALIDRMIKHDRDVYEGELHELNKFASEKGLYEYYYSLNDDILNKIAEDYFETYQAI